MSEDNNNIHIGEEEPAKALPVKAHITPIMLNTIDIPIEKDNSCANNLSGLSFE